MKATLVRRITSQDLLWLARASNNVISQVISLCRARALTVSCPACQRHQTTFSCSMDLLTGMGSSVRISRSCPLLLSLHLSKQWWQVLNSPKLRKLTTFNWQMMRLISFLKLKCWPLIKPAAEWSRKLSKNQSMEALKTSEVNSFRVCLLVYQRLWLINLEITSVRRSLRSAQMRICAKLSISSCQAFSMFRKTCTEREPCRL